MSIIPAMLVPQTEEDNVDNPLQSLHQFSLDVAHDLRGPLAGMGLLAVVAQQHLQRGDLAATREDLQRIADQAQWSQVALDALWRLADHLERPLEPRLCSLDEVAQAAAAEAVLSVQAHVPGRRLPTLQVAPLGQAMVDRGLVHVILVNLIGNALKFNLDHEEVAVGVHRVAASDGAGLALIVSDNGAGFDPSLAAQPLQPPLQPPQRPGAIAQPPGHGLGLGLSIVRRAAQRLGGRVEVQSAPGSGTTVRVSIAAG